MVIQGFRLVIFLSSWYFTNASIKCTFGKRYWWFNGSNTAHSDTIKVLSEFGNCARRCSKHPECACFELYDSIGECRLLRKCGAGENTSADILAGKDCSPTFYEGVVEGYLWALPFVLRLFAVVMSMVVGCCARPFSRAWTDLNIEPHLLERQWYDIGHFEKRQLMDQPVAALAARFGYTERQAVTIGVLRAGFGHWIPCVSIVYFYLTSETTKEGGSYIRTIDLVAKHYVLAFYLLYFWAVTFVIYDLLIIPWIQKNDRKLYLGLIFFTLPVKQLAFCDIMPALTWSNQQTNIDEDIFESAWNCGSTIKAERVGNHILTFLNLCFVAERACIGALVFSSLEAFGCLCAPMQFFIYMEVQIIMMAVVPCWLDDAGPGFWTVFVTQLVVVGFATAPFLATVRIKHKAMDP